MVPIVAEGPVELEKLVLFLLTPRFIAFGSISTILEALDTGEDLPMALLHIWVLFLGVWQLREL